MPRSAAKNGEMGDVKADKPINYKDELNKFKTTIKERAEDLVANVFPRKAVEMHNLFESDKFSLDNLAAIKAESDVTTEANIFAVRCTENGDSVTFSNQQNGTDQPPAKKRKSATPENNEKICIFPKEAVKSNSKIIELIEILKPLLQGLLQDCNNLKTWIHFQIPRIEDGNNFGVSIQEDILGEIGSVEEQTGSFYDQISRYFLTRAKVVTKIAKYPNVEDYRLNIKEIDEKQFISLRLTLVEVRNHYAVLHDQVTKNLEKIRLPRPIQSHSNFL